MATFCGVICEVSDEAAFYAKATPLGVRKLRDAKRTITIDTSSAFIDPSEKLALELSTFECATRAFAIVGQSSVDAYVVTEYVRGETVRKVLYERDEGGWQTSGAQRPWEKDLPVGEAPNEEDEDYDARRMTHGKLLDLARRLGWDFDAGPHATYEKRGLLARIFGK